MVKSAVLYLLARLSRIRSAVRLQFSAVLSRGEFAFVLFSAAAAQHLLSAQQSAMLLVVVTLSMVTTPLLMQALDRLLAQRLNPAEESAENPMSPMMSRR